MTTSPNAQPILDWFFENSAVNNLARAAGLDASSTARALQNALPRQLQALEDYSRTPLGDHQISEAVSVIPEFPSVTEALAAGNGALDLERAGQSLAPTLLREQHDRIVTAVSGETGVNASAVRRLLTMTLPLILSRLSWRDEPALRFLPLVGQVVRRAAPVAIPTNAAVTAAPRRAMPVQAVTTETTRRGVPWWLWLLPLLLLLLLGGCLYGMYRTPDNIKTTTPASTTTTTPPATQPATPPAETTNATTGEGGENAAPAAITLPFAITSPEQGQEVSANGFTMQGTGTGGATYTVRRAGENIGSFRVGDDGHWRSDVVDGAAPAGNVIYNIQDEQGTTLGTLNVRARGPEAGVTPISVTLPEANSDVPASGFDIQGSGTPGSTYTVYEDGSNIGSVTAAPDGTWGLNVAGATPGLHTYTVLDARGNRLALRPVNVLAGSSNANCAENLSISLPENATVSAPFRFGGRGGGKGYTVTVWRGSEQVGTRDVNLSGDCTWSYASNPGGKDGEKSTVRYEVRPQGSTTSAPAAGQVTLNVSGSGTNFNSKGEYVGPTK